MSATYARQEYEKKYRREHRDKLREQKRAWDADPVNQERRRAYNRNKKINIDSATSLR